MSSDLVLQEYKKLQQEYEEELGSLQKSANKLVSVRAVTFLAFLALLIWAIVVSRSENINYSLLFCAFFSSLLSLITFVIFAMKHEKVKNNILMLNKLLVYNNDGQKKLNHAWTDLETDGNMFVDAQHDYCDDLDLFGKGSIFQLVNSCYSKEGQKQLANWLLKPASTSQIKLRQEAVKELTPLLRFRHDIAKEEMLLQAKDEKVTSFISWIKDGNAQFEIKGSSFLLWVLPVFTLCGFFVGLMSGWNFNLPWIFPLFVSWIVLRSMKGKVHDVYDKIDKVSGGILAYHNIFKIIDQPSFSCEELQRLKQEMLAGGEQPAQKLKELARITMAFDNRHGMLYSVMNIVLLWDIRLLLRLQKWCTETSGSIDRWLQSLFQIQALNSLASFSYINPQYPFPEFHSEKILRAEGLGHPCIAQNQRKINDFSLGDDQQIAIITGSNMSGKSTMLRSIGLNVVLANTGSCVCASSLVIGDFHLRTCMRARDDLQKGFSYFYAELHKLKQVIDGLSTSKHLLFLVDEMLSGTNSRERTIASMGIIKHLFSNGASGVVATHDLFLASLADEFSQIHNFHFTDNVVDEQMHFDYKLRQGPVQTSNALFLMRKVGIDVELENSE
ncbi:hypothetical protein [Candidatus Uabimicrobium sp. HlEnr_7]|uniref:MutS-related protein n=1 Tax=Candidatus Uabimicrobium helgolandensis TaxID=3095367 RepID=UPI0035572326